MSHKHDALLQSIFHDPVSANIHWREVESLLGHLGSDLEQLSGGRLRARLGHAEIVLHRPHHGSTVDRHAVHDLRGFLAASGNSPSQLAAGKHA
jgi:hypothetical protein